MASYKYTFDEYVDYIKNKYPNEIGNLSPKAVYMWGKSKERTPGVEPMARMAPTYTTTNVPAPPTKEEETSPGFFSSLSDYWVDSDSPDWMKSAYNHSITGLTEQVASGKPRYDLTGYTPDLLEEIGSGLLSFTFPLDALAFVVGGGLGNIAIKGGTSLGARTVGGKLTSLGAQGITKRFTVHSANKAIVKNISGKSSKAFIGEIAEKALTQGVRTGIQFGVYEGAMSGLKGAAYVGPNGEKLSDYEILKETLGGVSHGFMLGGTAGYGAGFFGSKWVNIGKRLKAKKAAGAKLTAREMKMLQRTKYAIPNAKAFGWEAGVFTTPAVKDEFVRYSDGQGFEIGNIWRAAMVNAGMVGVMHGTRHTLTKAKEKLNSWNKDIHSDIQSAFAEKSSLSRLQTYFSSQEYVSTGAEKAAYKKALEVLSNEKNTSSDKIKFELGEKKRLIKDIENTMSGLEKAPGKTSPEQLVEISKRLAKGINSINETIGLTGDLELARLMNDFGANIINNIKLNTSSNNKSKNNLINSYKSLRGKNKRDKNTIIVERDGKASELNLGETHKYGKRDLREAINAEADGAFHGAAKSTFQAIDRANRLEPHNTTADFIRGFKFDAEGNPIPAQNLKTSNHRSATGFVKRSGRNKEVTDRANNLRETHENLIKDSMSMKSTVEARNKYSQSKSIILNLLEKSHLDGFVHDKYLSLSSVKNKTRALNEFSKWLADKKEKNLYEASQSDIRQFLKNEGTRNHALAIKELIEKSPSKFTEFTKGKINVNKFKDFAKLLPDKATETTVNESVSRIAERDLSRNFNYTKQEIKNIRQEVTGKRKFKDMTESEKIKVANHIKKIINKPYETTSRELRNIESKILIRADKIGFSHSNLRKLLKSFNVKDGMFKNVRNPETLKETLLWLTEKPSDFITPNQAKGHSSFFIKTTSKMLNTLKLPGGLKRYFMPGWYVLKHYGGKPGKKLYKAYIESQVTLESLMGDYHRQFYAIKKTLKTSTQRNRLRFIDETLRKTANSKADLAFIDKMLNEKGKITIDGKTIKLKEGELTPWDATFEGGSKEWKASMQWKQYTDNIWRNLDIAVKNTVTKGEYLKFKQKYGPRYVNSYFSRVINPQVLKSLFGGVEQSWATKIAIKELKRSVNLEADKKGLKKGTKQRKDFIEKEVNNEKNIADAISEIHDYLTNNISRIDPKYLKKRGLDISDENGMVEIEGRFRKKKVQAYISNFEAVSQNYAKAMSGAIAGAAHFPDLAGFASKGFGIAKQSLGEMANSGGMAAYASKMVQSHLGIERDVNRKINNGLYKAATAVTNAGVALGLSTPVLPGLKNIVIGQARNIGAYGLLNSVRGFAASFSRTQIARSRELGHFQSGIKSLDLIQKGLGLSEKPIIKHFNMANQFRWWNMMEPSEGLNRISSKVAGMLYFEETLRTYKGERNVVGDWHQKSSKEFKRYLQERLHFTPEEIAFIDNTPLHQLVGAKDKQTIEVMKHLTQKAAHFSHISTQGGTQVGMLPLWMSHPLARPLTLFYRMAAAATFDTYVNFIKPAVKNRNPFPLVRLGVAHALTGAALNSLYKQLFGVGNPLKGVDPKDDGAKTNQMMKEVFADAYRSGFFGTVEGLFSPYDGILSGKRPYSNLSKMGSGGLPMMDPILLRYGLSTGKNMMALFFEKPETRYTKTEWTGKVFTNFLADISSVGAQARTIWMKENASYLSDRKNLRRLYNLHLASKGKDRVASGAAWEDPRYFMFDDMRTEIFKDDATKDDKIKAVMIVYNTLVHEMMTNDNFSGRKAHKEAIGRITSSLSGSRPIPITWKDDANKNADYREFYLTLNPEMQEKLYKSEVDFSILKKEIKKVLYDPNSYRKYGNLGGIENMIDSEYSPTDFYDNLSDEDKKLYQTYQVFN